jgi:periplasmic divalent cation tolerance protein
MGMNGSDMNDVVQVQTTIDSRDVALHMADVLVEKRLAACVQVIGPVQSTYRWRGAIEHDSEWIVVVKTVSSHILSVREKIEQLHSYELPEILFTGIEGGSEEYLEWVRNQVK